MNTAKGSWTRFSDRILDAVYPIRCALCGRPGPVLCESCLSEMRPNEAEWKEVGDLAYSLPIFAYSGRAARAVQRLKFDRITGLAQPMAAVLAEKGEEWHCFRDSVLVPVPIHWSRQFQRGFNQSEILARPLPCPILRNALKRVRATRPQAGRPAEERRRDLEGAFQANQELVQGQNIVLIDDVVTTGHTAQACAAALRQAGAAEVGILAFAGNP